MSGIQEVFSGIYQILVPLPGNPLKEVNCYLIRGRERNLLVDTGFRRQECWDALQQGLRRLGVSMERTDIFLTHSHADHSGLAPELICEGGRIYAGVHELSRLDVPTRTRVWSERDAYFAQEGMDTPNDPESPGRKYACVQYENYVPVTEGQTLWYGPYTLECLAMPGHSPGHMCLYLRRQKVLFLGDHVLFDITPNITSWMDFPDALGIYLDSLERLKQYEVALALPGHRGIHSDLAGRIEALKAHHQDRLREILQIVRDAPGLTGYDIAGKMTWHIQCQSWEDFPTAQRSYAVGEAMAHLDYLRVRGVLARRSINGVFRYTAGAFIESEEHNDRKGVF